MENEEYNQSLILHPPKRATPENYFFDLTFNKIIQDCKIGGASSV